VCEALHQLICELSWQGEFAAKLLAERYAQPKPD
jgi:hypothetical protein